MKSRFHLKAAFLCQNIDLQQVKAALKGRMFSV